LSSSPYLYGVDDVSGLRKVLWFEICLHPQFPNSLIINQLKNSLLKINQLHIKNKNILKIVHKKLGNMSSSSYLYVIRVEGILQPTNKNLTLGYR
jgi:predicted naringenin-chalcone synthase